MKSTLIAFLVVAATGCTESGTSKDCVNGVCAGDLEETRTFAGPCRAAGIGYAQHCTFAYDGSQRLAKSACHYYYDQDELDESENDALAEYHYDAAGKLASIDQTERQTDTRTWTFGATTIDVVDRGTNTLYKQFDRSLFAFYPGTLVDRMVLRADLGMTKLGPNSYTWTKNGNAWVRSGGLGPNLTYALDAAGHILSVDPGTDRFEYDGTQLAVQHDSSFEYRYVYDRGGNLDEVIATGLAGPNDVRPLEVYDYSCWSK